MNQTKYWEAERHYSRLGAIFILFSVTISLFASAFIVYLLTSYLSLSDNPIDLIIGLLFALGLMIRSLWLVILLIRDIFSRKRQERAISGVSTIFGSTLNLSQSVMNQAAIILGVVVYATPFAVVFLLLHVNISSGIVEVLGIAYTVVFVAFLFRKHRWFDSLAELRRRTSGALVEKCKNLKHGKDCDELNAHKNGSNATISREKPKWVLKQQQYTGKDWVFDEEKQTWRPEGEDS